MFGGLLHERSQNAGYGLQVVSKQCCSQFVVPIGITKIVDNINS